MLTPSLGQGMGNAALTVDYYRIKISDAINGVDRQFQLSQCYGGDAKFCKDITRRQTFVGGNSAGALAIINSSQENTGGH